MKKQILVSVEFQCKKVAVLEDGRMEEYFVERPCDRQLVGSIFKGKVSSIVPGIGAAFIDLGLEKNGFLYVADVLAQEGLPDDDEYDSGEAHSEDNHRQHSNNRKSDRPATIQELLKKDQDVIVQVVKEPFGTKGARLTCQISLAGRFVVFMPHNPRIGISKRIDDKRERDRIREIIKSVNLPKDSGLIVRTAARNTDAKVLERDIKFLIHQWKRIQRRSVVSRAPTLLHEEYGLVVRMVRDVMSEAYEGIVIDDKTECRRVETYMKAAVPTLLPKLEQYKGDAPLFSSYGIQKDIDKIYEPRAFLKSGGHIVIQQTEALVAIDVNTGKFTGTRNLEETAYKTNCEAAREIAKQIRLRDLGGIIIIDFIDMDRGEHRRSVLKILEDSLKKDRAKTSVLNLSQLGLVEMTRQRMRRSLESASTQSCPYCLGKGIVKSRDTVATEALQKLVVFLRSHKKETIEIAAAPEVIEVLGRDNAKMVREIEKGSTCRVQLAPDPQLHVEEVHFKRVLDRRKRLW